MILDRFFKKPIGSNAPKGLKPSGHAGGPIPKEDLDEVYTHVPKFEMKLVDPDTSQEMKPELIQSAQKAGTLKPIFFNPNQSIDYRVIAAVCKNTIAGSLMNAYTQLIVGAGMHPELELLDPSGDSKKDQKELEKHKGIIKELRAVERAIDRDNDITFTDYVTMLIDATSTYGRAALVWDSATAHREIPTTVKYAHPADLSITVFDDKTFRLESVLWQFGGSTPVPAKDLVYLWNPLATAKYQNAWQYGASMVLPMLDAARTLRKIVGVDFPAMAEATWAGMFIMAVRPQGQNEDAKEDEYKAVTKNMVRGGPTALLENPEDLLFHNVDFAPKVNEFKDLTHFLIQYCAACLNLPASMFFDEADSNRSAARSKIQLTINSVIAPIRERLGRQICNQTYQKWFEKLHGDLKDVIRINLVFEDRDITELYDKVAMANEVDKRHQLTDQGYAKLSGIPNYAELIDPKKETTPGGGSNEKMHNLQKDNDGKNLDVGKSLNKEGME